MRSRQVPRAEWFSYFREFSEQHQEWLVALRVIHPQLGSQLEAKDLPLEGVVSDPEGRGPISIHLGRSVRGNVEHDIQNPIQVWVEMTDEGAEQAVDIESGDGTKTILEFRVAALPQAVDGILER